MAMINYLVIAGSDHQELYAYLHTFSISVNGDTRFYTVFVSIRELFFVINSATN